jgi:hypothetical protein
VRRQLNSYQQTGKPTTKNRDVSGDGLAAHNS